MPEGSVKIKHRKKHEPMTESSLLDMLTYQRCAWSEGEKAFINRYLGGYPQDSFGNIWIDVDSQNSSTLFSCHTDSVHPVKGTKQHIFIDPHQNEIFKHDGLPLGADDAIGIWLMLHMIHQGIPGTYIFHRAEERGGHGSKWIASNMTERLYQFDRAIAFDRRGTTDVITKQRGSTCCSTDFAEELSVRLGNGYKPCSGGVFTDTASYVKHIPECTNLSSGYDFEHTQDEVQDLDHAKLLYNLVTKIEWETLPTERDPSYVEPAKVYKGPYTHKNNFGMKGNAGFKGGGKDVTPKHIPQKTHSPPPAANEDVVVQGTPGRHNGIKGVWVGQKFYPGGQGKPQQIGGFDKKPIEVVGKTTTVTEKKPVVVPAKTPDRPPERNIFRFFDEDDALQFLYLEPDKAAEMLRAAYPATPEDLFDYTESLDNVH